MALRVCVHTHKNETSVKKRSRVGSLSHMEILIFVHTRTHENNALLICENYTTPRSVHKEIVLNI